VRGKLINSLATASITVLGAAGSQPALAQQGAQGGGLEEIVVTATRRALNLQDVPISIVAMTSADLTMQGIDSVQKLQGTIPNLSVIGGTNGPTSEVGFSIRGIPRVGFYIDGIWQPYTSGLADFNLQDIERIEVLRGPQGTLYGRDSTGGAIRVVTSEPGDEFAARGSVALGSFDRRDAIIGIDVPITDTLKSRISASSLNRNGYVHSIANNKDYGQVDMTNVAGDLVWSPSETFKLRAKYSDNMSHPTDARISRWAVPQGAKLVGFAYGAIDLYTLSGHPVDAVHEVAGYPGGLVGKWENNTEAWEPATIHTKQGSVEATWHITDKMTLTSWTGSIYEEQHQALDWDMTPYELVETYQNNKSALRSQEFQLSGSRGKIDWVGGFYYWNQTSDAHNPFWGFEEFADGRFSTAAVLATPQCQAPTTLAGCAAAINVYQNSIGNTEQILHRSENGYAAFGEADIHLNDKLDLTVGARYHKQDKVAVNEAPIPGVSSPVPAHIGPFVSGDPWAGKPLTTDSVTFDKTTTRVSLKRKFSTNVMGYVSYSEGFNAGGADPVTTATGRRLVSYNPETIKNFEVGFRSDLANGRIRFNASIFHTLWDDVQIRSNFVDPSIGVYAVTIITQNAAGAEANGIETELTWLATQKLKVNFNLGLLDTGYKSFLLDPTQSPVGAGSDFAQAPKQTYSVGMQHDAKLKSGASLTTRVDYNYVSGFQRYADPKYHPAYLGFPFRYEAGDYGLVNARLQYVPKGDARWEVSLFGTNLTDKQVVNGGFYGSIWELDWSTVERPREFGVEMKMSFK